MRKTIRRPKRWPLSWAVFLTVVLIGVAVIVVMADATTRTKIEPPIKPDGTVAHPYADDSQCPPGTDIVIWPKDRHSMIPNIPPDFSVCFVSGKPKKQRSV